MDFFNAGKASGKAEVRAEGKTTQTALNLLRQNLSHEVISSANDLPGSKLIKLKA